MSFTCDRDKYTYKIPTNDCLNKTHTMTSPADMPTWMGGFPKALPLDNELQAIDGAERESQFSPGTSALSSYLIPKVLVVRKVR